MSDSFCPPPPHNLSIRLNHPTDPYIWYLWTSESIYRGLLFYLNSKSFILIHVLFILITSFWNKFIIQLIIPKRYSRELLDLMRIWIQLIMIFDSNKGRFQLRLSYIQISLDTSSFHNCSPPSDWGKEPIPKCLQLEQLRQMVASLTIVTQEGEGWYFSVIISRTDALLLLPPDM